MTRTLFVGEPIGARPGRLRAGGQAQAAAIAALEAAVAGGRCSCRPAGPSTRVARDVIVEAGHGEHFGHGTGPRHRPGDPRGPVAGQARRGTPLPSPTVFSVEPGVYLDGEMGVRIEDLVLLDAAAGRVERLTRFPREVLVVGT